MAFETTRLTPGNTLLITGQHGDRRSWAVITVTGIGSPPDNPGGDNANSIYLTGHIALSGGELYRSVPLIIPRRLGRGDRLETIYHGLPGVIREVLLDGQLMAC